MKHWMLLALLYAGDSAVCKNNEFADFDMQFTNPLADTPTITVACGMDEVGFLASLVIVNPTETGCKFRPFTSLPLVHSKAASRS